MPTYQIDIPESLLTRDGKRYEPTGEYRPANRGEMFLASGQIHSTMTFDARWPDDEDY